MAQVCDHAGHDGEQPRASRFAVQPTDLLPGDRPNGTDACPPAPYGDTSFVTVTAGTLCVVTTSSAFAGPPRATHPSISPTSNETAATIATIAVLNVRVREVRPRDACGRPCPGRAC